MNLSLDDILFSAFVPIFIITALQGLLIWEGILQLLTLIVGLTLQWRFTRKCGNLKRAIILFLSYLTLNLGFALIRHALRAFLPS